jgi:hypothetical protein
MTPLQTEPNSSREAIWAERLCGHLDASAEALPHHVRERLRAGRQRAIDTHKGLIANDRAVMAHPADGSLRLARWLSPLAQSVLAGALLLSLLLGLTSLYQQHTERRMRDQIELDSALLTGDVPPAAYLDPGFAQFLKAQSRGKP